MTLGMEAGPDRVELRGLRVLGRHGVLAEEHQRAQPFEVDLDLFLDLSPAASSDRLPDTVDYGAAAGAAAGAIGGAPAGLLEHLAQRVSTEVMEACPGVQGVTVTLRKLRPPVPHSLEHAAVRLTRWRARSHRLAFLGLGSNLGDRWGLLRGAVASLEDLVGMSQVYESDPVGGPGGQGQYLNMVVELWTAAPARSLLGVAGRLEQAAGRVRTERSGPRTLDVDVLLVGDETIHDEDLVVPHPRMWERRFVLVPLAELAPDRLPSGWEAGASGHVVAMGSIWGPGGGPRRHVGRPW